MYQSQTKEVQLKRVIFIAVALAIAVLPTAINTTPALASGYTEAHLVMQAGEVTPQAHLLVMNPMRGPVGWYLWAQAYFGPTFQVLPMLQVGLGTGLEVADEPLRFGTFAYFEKGRVFSSFYWEDGGTGPWHQFVASYQPNTHLGFAVMDQRFVGTGPRAQYTYKRMQLWTASLFEGGDMNQLVTLRYSF